MREILFRGKRKDNCEWVYGYLCLDMVNNKAIENGDCDSGEVYVIDENTIGQYTGLTDKNGVKIFEGDIVSYVVGKPDGNSIEVDKEIVTFDYGQLLQLTYSDYLEVIGNIYDGVKE